MLRQMLIGTAAGALGTVALNVTTYLDMVARGRPSSSTPAETAKRIADESGVDLGRGSDDEREETADNRAQGLGALLGYVSGLGVGGVYGLLRQRTSVPPAAASVLLTGAAMAATNGPMAALGVTDPRDWGPQSWAADAIPHLAYGVVTAVAYDALTSGATTRR